MTHRGAVAAGTAATTGAAVTILREGGNAFDAAVGAGFAAAVAEPHLTSLAGGGFLLARGTGRGAPRVETVFDFFVATPGLGAAESTAEPVTTPRRSSRCRSGSVMPSRTSTSARRRWACRECWPGISRCTRRWAACRWRRWSTPPSASPGSVSSSIRSWRSCPRCWRRSSSGATKVALIFFDGDRPLAVGETLTNPHLGAFLADIAAGERTGFRADELGGSVTGEDLAAYRVVEREPLRVAHRGVRVLTNPPPSMGGTLVAHASGTVR